MSSAVEKKALYKRKQQRDVIYWLWSSHRPVRSFQHPHLLLLFQQQIYLLNLESHKKAKNSVRKVFNNEGVLITDPKKILQEILNFYSNLCKRDSLSPSEDMLNPFLNNPEIPKLSNNEVRICVGKLTVDGCYKSLQLFESNKSPGMMV